MSDPSQRALRDALGAFATGVTVVTAISPRGEAIGVTVNSLTSVSLHPPLILWCLQNSSTRRDAFAAGRRFAVCMLAAHQQALALRFAGKAPAKFPELASLDPDAEPPILPGTICRLDCLTEKVIEAGDHQVVLAAVTAFEQSGGSPLLFHGGRFGRFDLDPQSKKVEAWESYFGEWF